MSGHDTGEVREFAYEGFRYSCRVVAAHRPRLDPVLILGGAFQDKDSWRQHQPYFGAMADLVTVDLPGWGDADDLPARYGYDFLAAALEHLLTGLGRPRVNLVGASYGSLVAYCLAQRCPDRIARMVLSGAFDGVPAHTKATHERTVELLAAGRTVEFTEVMLSLLAPRTRAGAADGRNEALTQLLRAQFAGMTPEAAVRYAENSARVLAHPRLRSGGHEVPTLVLAGELDLCTPPETGRRVAAMIPGAAFVTVPDAGHLMWLERPRQFVGLLDDFFSGRSVGELACGAR
ncbi:alpha/beta hydrolase [Streptomyces sp. MP131-18]|uniref:alpha/beta fold hydrolase n=1 Tax=Streptomyces sp. MP131-18 TaxID=1857892 RepID=UPI0009C571D5|nr:alpha/beta hydrolase [Streptomyces sp. MP131-18]ONK15493.1 Arylesterase [Streptomyces sp. MP131-18]